jgi:ATP-grasp domain
VKSQILAGGRGLGKFKNGLQGGVHIVPKEQAPELAKQMLGNILVTKQTGPAGKPVNVLYIAAKMSLTKEMYFAILLDRNTAGKDGVTAAIILQERPTILEVANALPTLLHKFMNLSYFCNPFEPNTRWW